MHTPAHMLIGFAAFSRAPRAEAWPVAVGSILPDLPIFILYAWERLVRGSSEDAIWTAIYYEPGWQAFIDAFNSIPLIGVGLLFAWAARSPRVVTIFGAMMLHCFVDLPLHHGDGHRHGFPLSDFRFDSPVSYYDPNHFGAVGGAIELTAALVATAWVAKNTASIQMRVALIVLAAAQAVSMLRTFA